LLPVYGSLYRAMPTETNRAILEWLAAWLQTADAKQMSVQMDALNSQSLGIDRSYFRGEMLGCTWEEFLHNEEIVNQEEMEVWLDNFFSMDVGVNSSFGQIFRADPVCAIAIMDSISHPWVTVILKYCLYFGRNASVISPRR
jgi:hypothetical protein